jgi:short-subunit dehydrogenase
MASDFPQHYGPWALVTGASSGIGEEFARQLAARGLHVAVVARRRERLEALATELHVRHGAEVRIIGADLTDPSAPDAIADATADLDVGLLVNNAGFGEKGGFLEIPLAKQLRMIELNCKVPVWLTHKMAPALIDRGRGGIVIVASTAAFQGVPYTSVYAATKSFDLMFGDALGYELARQGVDVVTVCPGPTDTEGPRRTGVNPDRVPVKLMPPEVVVRHTLDALGRRTVVIPGTANKAAAFLTRLVPRRLAARIAGRMIERVAG